MNNKYIFLITVLVLLLALGYIVCKDDGSGLRLPKHSDKAKPPKISDDKVDLIKAQIKKMSMEEKIGQLVIVGLDGYEVDDYAKQLIEKYHVGGFVLFKHNIKDARQMLALLNSLKQVNSINKIPLFLSIDEEGGKVSRMPEEFIKIPSSKRIGQINNTQLAYQVGNIFGKELKAFGLNMDFGPVLDINSNPKNPVIGDRSFGTDASIVSKLGVQMMKGIQAQNIISVVKHFPGHGDTSVDSHIGLPMVNTDMERLNSFELVPFNEAIKNKVDAIMIAHILLEKIDPDNPASFSKTIITDILRKHMKFDGIVITDDMTMGAVVNNYDIGESAVKSIIAGSDIVLICHENDKKEAVITAINRAVETGLISPDRIDKSVYRILMLKQKYDLSDTVVNSVELQEINNKIRDLYNDFSL
jgi:beta-N-acetylhexosaminidase